jgi:hypothetical protein
MFATNGVRQFLMTSLVSVALAILVASSSGHLSISVTRHLEIAFTAASIILPIATATSGNGGDDIRVNANGYRNGMDHDASDLRELIKPAERIEPTTAQIQFIPRVTTPTLPTPSTSTSQLPTATLTEDPVLTATPNLRPPLNIITNVNNVNLNNVQNFEGAVRGTPGCAPVAGTIMLGPSKMEGAGARILAAFDPCVLTEGKVLLNLPDEHGIQLVAANIQRGHTTQSAIIPLQRIAAVAEGQILFGAVLNEKVTGPDQARGESATLNGNINALFLWNNSGHAVEFVGNHNASLNILLR